MFEKSLSIFKLLEYFKSAVAKSKIDSLNSDASFKAIFASSKNLAKGRIFQSHYDKRHLKQQQQHAFCVELTVTDSQLTQQRLRVREA